MQCRMYASRSLLYRLRPIHTRVEAARPNPPQWSANPRYRRRTRKPAPQRRAAPRMPAARAGDTPTTSTLVVSAIRAESWADRPMGAQAARGVARRLLLMLQRDPSRSRSFVVLRDRLGVLPGLMQRPGLRRELPGVGGARVVAGPDRGVDLGLQR